jgi:hypothetical protein
MFFPEAIFGIEGTVKVQMFYGCLVSPAALCRLYFSGRIHRLATIDARLVSRSEFLFIFTGNSKNVWHDSPSVFSGT